MQTMNFNIGTDRRGLVSDVQNFKIGNDAKNWVQARQFEGEMRTVVVNVMEGTIPLNLTGATIWFEGLMSDGKTRIIDAKHGTILSPTTGQFRFEFPYAAFATFGSYKQSFFKIVRDGKSIATLEFTLDVLVNLVEDGIVPLDYITPFQGLYAKLEAIYHNADADIQVMVTKWQQQITELITGLNGDYAKVQTTVNLVQQQLTTLEAEIKQDGLFTQAEAEAFNQEINNHISTVKQELDNKIDHISTANQELDNKIDHILKYHSISVSVSPNMGIGDNDISHLQKLGSEVTLVSMVNINDSTDSNPQLDDDTRIKDAISRLKTAGIKIDMIKPHLGVNWSDAFSRGLYTPALYSDFFDNWKKILLYYAEICKQNDIPILCLGCEQADNFDVSHADAWENIIANIRANYPKLLLTVAFDRLALVPSYEWPAKLDYIGTNVYPALSPYFDENNLLKLDDLKANFYYDMNGNNFGANISAINDAYHLPIFITETGCMPQKDGLVQLISQYRSQTPYDYHVSALYMETAFSSWMKDIPSIIGFAWWNIRSPFNFFDGNTESEAEMVYKKYVGGGLI